MAPHEEGLRAQGALCQGGNLLIKGSAMFSPQGTTNLCNKEQPIVGEQINVMMGTGHSRSRDLLGHSGSWTGSESLRLRIEIRRRTRWQEFE